jgi:hypothetical protein
LWYLKTGGIFIITMKKYFRGLLYRTYSDKTIKDIIPKKDDIPEDLDKVIGDTTTETRSYAYGQGSSRFVKDAEKIILNGNNKNNIVDKSPLRSEEAEELEKLKIQNKANV